jgi:hypothetical protein
MTSLFIIWSDIPGNVAMPGSTGGSPQLLGGCRIVQQSAAMNAQAQSQIGPMQAGVGGPMGLSS